MSHVESGAVVRRAERSRVGGDCSRKTAAQLLGFRRHTSGNLKGVPGDSRYDHPWTSCCESPRRSDSCTREGLERVYPSGTLCKMAGERARSGAAELGHHAPECPNLGSFSTTPPSPRPPESQHRRSCATGCARAACSRLAASANTKTARSGSATWAISVCPKRRIARLTAPCPDTLIQELRVSSWMKLQTEASSSVSSRESLSGIVARIPDLVGVQRIVLTLEPLGIMFIRLLTMTIVPLIVASLFVGVASLGDIRRLGRIGGKTLVWFFGSTIVAATIGLVAALIARLGEDSTLATRGFADDASSSSTAPRPHRRRRRRSRKPCSRRFTSESVRGGVVQKANCFR